MTLYGFVITLYLLAVIPLVGGVVGLVMRSRCRWTIAAFYFFVFVTIGGVSMMFALGCWLS
jgi:hypothetical protein